MFIIYKNNIFHDILSLLCNILMVTKLYEFILFLLVHDVIEKWNLK